MFAQGLPFPQLLVSVLTGCHSLGWLSSLDVGEEQAKSIRHLLPSPVSLPCLSTLVVKPRSDGITHGILSFLGSLPCLEKLEIRFRVAPSREALVGIASTLAAAPKLE